VYIKYLWNVVWDWKDEEKGSVVLVVYRGWDWDWDWEWFAHEMKVNWVFIATSTLKYFVLSLLRITKDKDWVFLI
jgi:hypothetical protein